MKEHDDLWSLVPWYMQLAVIVLSALGFLAFLVFASKWIEKPFELTSPERFEQMSREVNDRWEALKAQEASIDRLEDEADLFLAAYGEDMARWPQGKRDEYLQLKSQVSNLVVAYNQSCSAYNALWKDEWREFNAPDDVSRSCELID